MNSPLSNSRPSVALLERALVWESAVGWTPECLAEGAQMLERTDTSQTPTPMLGHVTSSYLSPELGRSIAMAVVRGGAQREGQRLFAMAGGRITPVKVVSPVFVDPKGERQHA